MLSSAMGSGDRWLLELGPPERGRCGRPMPLRAGVGQENPGANHEMMGGDPFRYGRVHGVGGATQGSRAAG